jgi:IMP dehydrogenase
MAQIREGLTFDDVLLVPKYSTVKSRQNVNLETFLTKHIKLREPVISSNMDTVTEAKMAIAMAQLGGIGIIHRYCSIEEQAQMVSEVKRSESYIIYDPFTLPQSQIIEGVNMMSLTANIKSFLVVNSTDGKLEGILTNRDTKFADPTQTVGECMTALSQIRAIQVVDGVTKENAQTVLPTKLSMANLKKLMNRHRVQRIPIVNENNEVMGLVCLRDIVRLQSRPNATLDSRGRLRCGAAVGVKEDVLERTRKLIEAGVDVVVVDIAHGHSELGVNTVKLIKSNFNIDVIAGNVVTAQGAKDLIEAGADAIKVGIGAASICTTRIVAGAGVPQLTALMDTYLACKTLGVPMISDGGNRNSGNICKALAAGASCVMLGRMIAGSDESPGSVLVRDGKRIKRIRGMAGAEANISNASRQKTTTPNLLKFTPEGVEGYVPYSGPVEDTIKQILDGVRSGCSYSGAHNLDELRMKAEFIRLSHNAVVESGVHDIIKS